MVENNEQNDNQKVNQEEIIAVQNDGNTNEGSAVLGAMNDVDESYLEPLTLSIGQEVEASVEKLLEKHVVVSVDNYAKECIIPISELSNFHIEKVSDVISIGERVNLIVLKVEDNKTILSKKRFDAESVWSDLENKFNSESKLSAKVVEIVKGGVVVDIGIRGFVPASMISDSYVEDLHVYQDKILDFKILEMDKEKLRVILSHKEIIKHEKALEEQKAIDTLNVDDVIDGTVMRLSNFGAFVLVGKIEGLVHISEISHQHVKNTTDILEVGQQVKVKVIELDRDLRRVRLSIKGALPDPWEVNRELLHVGAVLGGKVKRFVNFGAFVEVFPGVEGLLHVSEISNKHVNTPHEVLKIDEAINVKVLMVNFSEKKLSLSMKALEEFVSETNTKTTYSDVTTGFSIGEILADKLKDFNIIENE